MARKSRKSRRRFGGFRRRFRRRNTKPSLVDLLSLTPGLIHSAGQMGGFSKMIENPKAAGSLLIENYLCYDPDTGKFVPMVAFQNQWKPFVGIQIGQWAVKKIAGRRLGKVKLLGFRLFR